jgi:hypothetical protein
MEDGLWGERCDATRDFVEETAVRAASSNRSFLDSRVETQL